MSATARGPFSLDGRRAVVTGASRGLGRAIAVARSRSFCAPVEIWSNITFSAARPPNSPRMRSRSSASVIRNCSSAGNCSV